MSELVPFQLLEIPAAGGFATLCVVRTLRDNRLVALKVLKSSFVNNADALTRLRDEARVLRRLRHPNIVRVEELMNLDGRPVVFMEWVEGTSLDAVLRRLPQGLPAPIAADIVRQVALALDAAYNTPVGAEARPLRVIHRDLKPSNILLSADGQVKVVDFGLAKGDFSERESRTMVAVVGTRGYSAPERLDGDPDTPSVDVYALGISLFELLTGKPPVVSRQESKHDNAVLSHLPHIQGEGLSPSAVTKLKHVVRRMCLYEPTLRPHHAEVAHDIEALLEGAKPDLAAFAAEHVRPIVAARERVPPEKHPHYEDVRFLQAFTEWDTMDAPSATEAASDAELRRFLAAKGWEKRVPDLQLLLAQSARWTARPFIDLLERARAPKWQFWSQRPSDEQVALALEFLRQRGGASVERMARHFVGHEDDRVANAARALVPNE